MPMHTKRFLGGCAHTRGCTSGTSRRPSANASGTTRVSSQATPPADPRTSPGSTTRPRASRLSVRLLTMLALSSPAMFKIMSRGISQRQLTEPCTRDHPGGTAAESDAFCRPSRTRALCSQARCSAAMSATPAGYRGGIAAPGARQITRALPRSSAMTRSGIS